MSNLDRRKRRGVLRLSTILGFCFSLAAQSSISEAQSPAELRLRVEPGWNPLPVIETPSDPDTPVRSSVSIQDTRQRGLSIPDIESTVFSPTSEPQLMVGDGAFENQAVHWVFASQAQDLTLPIPQETVEKNAEQTRTSSSTVAEGWHAVHFIKTHIYDDPQVDRVLRWDPSAKAYKDLSVGDRLEPTVMYWLHRSAPGMLSFSVLGGTARTPQPLTTASGVESQKTPRSLVESAPVIGLGDFETPSVATKNDVHAAMPKSVITGHGEKTMVHLAYIAKDEQGDHIEVLHSLKSGRAGSFRREQGRRVATALPGWTITELAVAASSEKLVVAWIEKGREGDKTLMRIQEKQLMFTGAQEPTPSIVQAHPGVGEADPSWKRTLSLALDPDGHVHMTWNQANQVLYAYDFEIERTPDGRPLNVFNQHVRTPATEIVKYKAQYAPRADGRCDCEGCWCDESYPIRDEPDPKKDGQPRGPYIDRTHEAYAYAPSLHIGPKSVMIIAKQLRLWEDHPVPSEAWQHMLAKPIYSTTIVQRAQPTKWVQGWRQTWKAAYEPGDEHRWAGLGFQYQYLYQGTWHEDDQIVFAHRSLEREDTKSLPKKERSLHHPVASWNLSVVDGHFAPQVSQKPSYPKVAHMPSGSLIAVYEKGPQHDANQADGNPLFYATSDDGQVWASPKNLLAEGEPLAGYLPQVAISGRGEIGVAYYRPSLSTDLGISGRVQIARSRDQGRTWNVDTLNEERRTERLLDVAPLHGTTLDTETTTKAAYSDHYAGEPSLTADGDLFFAAFVHQAKEAHKRNRILTTRASRDQSVRQLDATVERPSSATSAPPTVKVALVNKHHVKVYDAPPEELVAAVEASLEASPQAPLWASNPGAPAGAHAALTSSPPLMQVELVEGEAVVSWAPANAFHTDEAVPPHPNPNPDLNYTKAIAERESLIRRTTLQASEGGRYDYADFYPPLSREGAYQVEYRPANHRFGDDQVPFDPRAASLYEGDDPDSIHLAGFERVWVYTLGIALAQLSRTKTVPGLTIPEHRARTQAMARYLCGHAVVDQANPHELKGWHFSWNTTGDSFKDPRLVTGANAWAIHGLGVFITSEAFANLPQDEEQAWFRQCYQSALLGLQRHRRTFEVGHQARQVSLMTAGWSTRGLEAVDRPFPIQGDGEPSPVEAHHERWAYYSVVDAIGYDVYDEAQPPALKACADASLCAAGEIPEDAWQSFTLSERAWSRLKRPEIARNVVTEHNLDVLSVLNHALNHTGALGLSNKGALEAWRNEVRDGIFYALWDQVPPSKLAYLAEREPHKQAWLKDEASTDAKSPMGRIVTGGAFQEDGTFSKSSHTAIDNCSWLALSVDYRDLPPSDEGAPSIYVSRLERCLQYTILRFAKKMGFSDSGPKYYGTHYFQNAFRDPYINPSDLQESSYHLEATMGLILGLHRFVGAHPEVQSAEGLEYEAKRLWANAQTFTRDHGFPYSSQRIQDLSTLLSSSTAILWFIDVHDALETPPSSFPPAALAMGQSFFGSASFLGGLETSLALGPRPEAAAYWVYGVEVIKQLGAREALKLVLTEILATGVFTAITGEIHQEEINDLVDQLLVDENHNVVVVEEHVPFEVPADYAYVGRSPPLEPSNPKDYYTSVREIVSAYPSYWEEAFSDSIIANLGFGVGSTTEEQEEAAQALRAMFQNAIPQDVILQKTWDGIEVYRKLRLFQPLDRFYQAPRGVVLHLGPDHEGPKLIHHQPGSWTNWYEGEIAASDIPEAYKDTYIQWIHQWLLDIVLGVPSCKQRHSSDAFGITAPPRRCPTTPLGWDPWRTEATKDITKGGLIGATPQEPFVYAASKLDGGVALAPPIDARGAFYVLPQDWSIQEPTEKELFKKAHDFQGPAVWLKFAKMPGHAVVPVRNLKNMNPDLFEVKLATAGAKPNKAKPSVGASAVARTVFDFTGKRLAQLPILLNLDTIRLYGPNGKQIPGIEKVNVSLKPTPRDVFLSGHSSRSPNVEIQVKNLGVFVAGKAQPVVDYIQASKLSSKEYWLTRISSSKGKRQDPVTDIIRPIWPDDQKWVAIEHLSEARYYVDQHGQWDVVRGGWMKEAPSLETLVNQALNGRPLVWGISLDPPGHTVFPSIHLDKVDPKRFRFKLATGNVRTGYGGSNDQLLVDRISTFDKDLTSVSILSSPTTIRTYTPKGHVIANTFGKDAAVSTQPAKKEELLALHRPRNPVFEVYSPNTLLYYRGTAARLLDYFRQEKTSYEIIATTSGDSGRDSSFSMEQAADLWASSSNKTPWIAVYNPHHDTYYIDKKGEISILRTGLLQEPPTKKDLWNKAKRFGGPAVYGYSDEVHGDVVIPLRDLFRIDTTKFELKLATLSSDPSTTSRMAQYTASQVADAMPSTVTEIPLLVDDSEIVLYTRDGHKITSLRLEASLQPKTRFPLLELAGRDIVFEIYVPALHVYLAGPQGAIRAFLEKNNISKDDYEISMMTHQGHERTPTLTMPLLKPIMPNGQTHFLVASRDREPYFVDKNGKYDALRTGWMKAPPDNTFLWDFAEKASSPALWGTTKEPAGHSVVALRDLANIDKNNFSPAKLTASQDPENKGNVQLAMGTVLRVSKLVSFDELPVLVSLTEELPFRKDATRVTSHLNPYGREGAFEFLGTVGYTKKAFVAKAKSYNYPTMQVKGHDNNYYFMAAHLAEQLLNPTFLGEQYFVQFLSLANSAENSRAISMARFLQPEQKSVETYIIGIKTWVYLNRAGQRSFENGQSDMLFEGAPPKGTALLALYDKYGFHIALIEDLHSKNNYLVRRSTVEAFIKEGPQSPSVRTGDGPDSHPLLYEVQSVTATYDDFVKNPPTWAKGKLVQTKTTPKPQPTSDQTWTGNPILSHSQKPILEKALWTRAQREKLDLVQALTEEGGVFIFPFVAWNEAEAVINEPLTDVTIASLGSRPGSIAKTAFKRTPHLAYVKVMDRGQTMFWNEWGERIHPYMTPDRSPIGGRWYSDLFYGGLAAPSDDALKAHVDVIKHNIIVVQFDNQPGYVGFPTSQPNIWDDLRAKGPVSPVLGGVHRGENSGQATGALMTLHVAPRFSPGQDYLKVVGGTSFTRFFDKLGHKTSPYIDAKNADKGWMAAGFYVGREPPSDARIIAEGKALNNSNMIKAYNPSKDVYSVFPTIEGAKPLEKTKGGRAYVQVIYHLGAGDADGLTERFAPYSKNGYVIVIDDTPLAKFRDATGKVGSPYLSRPTTQEEKDGRWWATGFYSGEAPPDDETIREASHTLKNATMIVVFHKNYRFHGAFPAGSGGLQGLEDQPNAFSIEYVYSPQDPHESRKVAIRYSKYFTTHIAIREEPNHVRLRNTKGALVHPHLKETTTNTWHSLWHYSGRTLPPADELLAHASRFGTELVVMQHKQQKWVSVFPVPQSRNEWSIARAAMGLQGAMKVISGVNPNDPAASSKLAETIASRLDAEGPIPIIDHGS